MVMDFIMLLNENLLVNLKMETFMVMDFIMLLKENILVNLKMETFMVMEYYLNIIMIFAFVFFRMEM
jgi:hypothetical protein